MASSPTTLQIRFTPTWLPTLAAVAMIALTLNLAQWQQRRAGEKERLQAEFDHRGELPQIALDAGMRDAAALQYRSVRARGEWNMAGQVYVDNKFHDNAVGYYVYTPMKLAGGNAYVLVNRGWVARGPAYPAPPAVPAPTGVDVEGIVTIPSHRFLELSGAAVEGTVWQNLTVERYHEKFSLDLLPVVVLAGKAADGLLPVAEKPDAGRDKHIEYMLTWYSLAATLLVLWIGLNLKIKRLPVGPAEPAA